MNVQKRLVDDDGSPTRRNVGQDIGNVEPGFFGGKRGGHKYLHQDLVWKGMNGSPRVSSSACLRFCEASFEHRRGRATVLGVGDISKETWLGDGQGVG